MLVLFLTFSAPLQTVRHEQDSNELNFDISELNTERSSTVEQVYAIPQVV